MVHRTSRYGNSWIRLLFSSSNDDEHIDMFVCVRNIELTFCKNPIYFALSF